MMKQETRKFIAEHIQKRIENAGFDTNLFNWQTEAMALIEISGLEVGVEVDKNGEINVRGRDWKMLRKNATIDTAVHEAIKWAHTRPSESIEQ